MAAGKRETERIGWIDIAKGIAILAVILGHTTPGGGHNGGKNNTGSDFFVSYAAVLHIKQHRIQDVFG